MGTTRTAATFTSSRTKTACSSALLIPPSRTAWPKYARTTSRPIITAVTGTKGRLRKSKDFLPLEARKSATTVSRPKTRMPQIAVSPGTPLNSERSAPISCHSANAPAASSARPANLTCQRVRSNPVINSVQAITEHTALQIQQALAEVAPRGPLLNGLKNPRRPRSAPQPRDHHGHHQAYDHGVEHDPPERHIQSPTQAHRARHRPPRCLSSPKPIDPRA